MWQTYAMLSTVFAAPVLRGTPAPVLQARLGFDRGAEVQKKRARLRERLAFAELPRRLDGFGYER